MSEWTAIWPDGTEVTVTTDGWSVTGPNAAALSVAITDAARFGWPPLAGWSIDRSPGFDDQWMYLRLLAMGAVQVSGPFPQAAETVSTGMDSDLVVG